MVRLYYYRDQKYSTLKAQCEKEQSLFVDKEFPPESQSLFFSRSSVGERVVWKRPKDICSPLEPMLFVGGADSHDVTQGKLGNCWFVAACSSLALRPSLLDKVIPDKKHQEWDPQNPDNYKGIFRFRFYRQGKWTEVVVDDMLPTINGELVYIHSTEKNEFWSALVEKAYAKMAGTYEALEAGNTGDALVDFTGGVGESINLKEGGYSNDAEKRDQLFKTMQKGMKDKSLMSASIKVTNRNEMEQKLETGLVKGHAYGVTAVRQITIGEGLLSLFNKQHFHMIRLRNPWGQKEWNGAWSDGSEEWNKLKESDRHKMGINFENDGEFWMSFEDFCSHFTNATLCHVINPSIINFIFKQWHVYKHNYQWTLGQNAGGCVQNRQTFLKNPQYRFDIKDGNTGQVMIALMQEDKRKDKSKGVTNLTIGFFVMKVEENRKYRIHSMFEKAGDSIFINSREVMSRMHLGTGRYVVVPSTYEPEVAGSFMIRIYTEKGSNASSQHYCPPRLVATETVEFLHVHGIRSRPIEIGENYFDTGFLDQDHSVGSKIWCCIPRCRTPQCIVSVYIVSASGLQRTGVSLTPDPYATISCEGRKVKTPIQKDTLEPKWNSGALFFVRQPQESQILVQVWDYNWTIDTFMGQAKIPIKITNSKTRSTHNLTGRRRRQYEEVPGNITVQIAAYTDLFSI